MAYKFDQLIDRRSTNSIKWKHYDPDVLPLWVADMDFVSPEPVIQALREQVEHGIFGYGMVPPELPEILVERLDRLYGWKVTTEDILFVPGVVTGFNLAVQSLAAPGEGVLIQTPVYPPFFGVHMHGQLEQNEMELARLSDGHYEVDEDLFEMAISGRTRAFLLCNPHNPVGKVFQRVELERMAEIALRHKLSICSDEIHCDLIFNGNQHIPIASISPEIAQQTITLMAPSKTYNIAGLDCSFAVIQNPEMRKKFEKSKRGLMGYVNIFGVTAALAAYRDGQEWLTEVIAYLESNRDFLVSYVNNELPGVQVSSPEGTYLAWLDCRESSIKGNPAEFFERKARVGLNDGEAFGEGGKGFVRLNFACPRSTLAEALEKMNVALTTV